MTLGIRRIQQTLIVMIGIVLVNVAIASDGPTRNPNSQEPLSAGNIKHIQLVSQAILQVRGQKKRELVTEVKPVLDDIQQVGVLLESIRTTLALAQASVELTGKPEVNLTLGEEPDITLTETTLWDTFGQYIHQLWLGLADNDETGSSDAPLLNQRQQEHIEQQLTQIKDLLQQRKEAVGEEIPALWQFWVNTDPLKQGIYNKLTEMDDQLREIQRSEGDGQLNKVTAMQKTLSPTPYVLQPPMPTITTITQHYR